jgi:hypothetical protein
MLFKKLWLKKLRSGKFIPFPIPDEALELTEKEQKKAVGGNGIRGTAVSGKRIVGLEIKVNPGAGNMTVSDYIAKQRKKVTGATL